MRSSRSRFILSLVSVLGLGCWVSGVSADSSVFDSYVEAHQSEVIRYSKAYGLMPSFLMAHSIVKSSLGSSDFDLKGYVQGLYKDSSSIHQRITESSSDDELIALSFRSEYSKSSTYVADMLALTSLSSLKNLDDTAYPDGKKPVYDYGSMRTALEGSDAPRISSQYYVPLGSDSLGVGDLNSSTVDTSVSIDELAYNDKVALDLLSNGNKNKSWWEFWSDGYLNTGFRITSKKFQPDVKMDSRVRSELAHFSIKGLGKGYHKTNFKGIYAYGSGLKRAVVDSRGSLLGIYSRTVGSSNLFGSYGQVLRADGGYLRVGYRVGSLTDRLPKAILGVTVKSFVESDVSQYAISSLGDKVIGQFYFKPLYKTLYLVKSGSGYIVYDRDLVKVGYSDNSRVDSTYSRVSTSKGDLWLRY